MEHVKHHNQHMLRPAMPSSTSAAAGTHTVKFTNVMLSHRNCSKITMLLRRCQAGVNNLALALLVQLKVVKQARLDLVVADDAQHLPTA